MKYDSLIVAYLSTFSITLLNVISSNLYWLMFIFISLTLILGWIVVILALICKLFIVACTFYSVKLNV